MGQWEEKLWAILNDPQAMSQIMSLAQSLGGQAPSSTGEEETPAENTEASSTPGLDLDPRLMEAGMRALSAWKDPDDPRAKLLHALRPFLKEERQAKLDRAIHITRLSKAVRAAMDGVQGGGKGDV